MIRMVCVAVIALVGVGCQSPDISVRQYQLAQQPQTAAVINTSKQLIIEPIVLVDYLKRPNILLKQDNNQLYVTKYHVWAEPLDKAIARTLVNHLNHRQQQWRVDHGLFSQCIDQKSCLRLILLVEEFYPTDGSTVNFSGKYRLSRNHKILTQQDFNLSHQLSVDGYPHAVDKLQQLILQLSSQIERQLPGKR